MKKSILNSICVAALTLSAVSCNDFLDVQPKGTLTEEVQFNSAQGFYDAMYGVYGKMATRNLYGENLSYGFTDKIGQLFGYLNTNNVDNEILKYDYQNNNVRTVINNIWGAQYEAISYVNNVIQNVESTSLRDRNLQLVRGEAYGLRAFLHFDLLRLFAPDYRTNPDAQYGLPYSDTYNLANKNVYTLRGTYNRILQDLDVAEGILANDTVVQPIIDVRNDYDHGRTRQFNLYAVYATKARVYLTMGDYTNAARYAQRVIDATSNFKLAESRNFADVRRFPANNEMIFGVYNRDLSQNIYNTFVSTVQASGNFTEGRRDVESLYETSTFTASNTDVRYTTFYRRQSGVTIFSRFISNESEIRTAPLEGLSLIRLPEMYYIVAESVYDTDKARAVAALNAVRASRGLEAVATGKTNTREAFEAELLAEYRREMPGEGQVFYALKHYNRSFTGIDGRTTINPSTEIFVLPRPNNELELGNRQQ